jgi:hypothetical protein
MNRQGINKKFGVTEEQLDGRAAEYENDTWDASGLGRIVMGRPSIANEEVRPVTFRMPLSKIVAVDKKAAERDETRSEFLRDAIDKALAI